MSKLNVLLILGLLFGFSYSGEEAIITLKEGNHLVIRGPISAESMRDAMEELHRLDISRKSKYHKIYIVLDSPGGSVPAGEMFISFAKTVRNVETITIFAASMAHAIAQALPGKRHITPDGMLMAHRAKAVFSGQFAKGEVEARLDMATQIVDRMERRSAKRIGIDIKKYRKLVKNEWWTAATVSLKEGVVDQITSIKCTNKLISSRIVKEVRSFFGSQKSTYSACPLFRLPVKN